MSELSLSFCAVALHGLHLFSTQGEGIAVSESSDYKDALHGALAAFVYLTMEMDDERRCELIEQSVGDTHNAVAILNMCLAVLREDHVWFEDLIARHDQDKVLFDCVATVFTVALLRLTQLPFQGALAAQKQEISGLMEHLCFPSVS